MGLAECDEVVPVSLLRSCLEAVSGGLMGFWRASWPLISPVLSNAPFDRHSCSNLFEFATRSPVRPGRAESTLAGLGGRGAEDFHKVSLYDWFLREGCASDSVEAKPATRQT